MLHLRGNTTRSAWAHMLHAHAPARAPLHPCQPHTHTHTANASSNDTIMAPGPPPAFESTPLRSAMALDRADKEGEHVPDPMRREVGGAAVHCCR